MELDLLYLVDGKVAEFLMPGLSSEICYLLTCCHREPLSRLEGGAVVAQALPCAEQGSDCQICCLQSLLGAE